MRTWTADGAAFAADDCPRAADAVAYLQRELHPGARTSFEGHLAGCPRCREELAEARSAIARLREGAPPAPRVDLLPRVLAGVGARGRSAARAPIPGGRGAWAGAALAAAALLAAAPLVRDTTEATPAPGSPASRAGTAVSSALEWLARAQEPAGHFSAARWGGDPRHEVGLTGLATLAFLAADPGGKRPEARRAVQFLLARQSEDGRFGPEFPGALYDHAIATVALLEVFGGGRAPQLREPIERALGYLRRVPAPGGGWSYLGERPAAANTAVSCWPLKALILARALGFADCDGAIRGGLDHLARVCDDRGRIGYQRAGDSVSGGDGLSTMAAYLLLLARDRGALPRAACRRVLDGIVRAGAQAEAGRDLYRDFFLRSALEALGPGRGRGFSEASSRRLAAVQVDSGPERGSWEPRDPWAPAGGRVYSTALAVLILGADARGGRLAAWLHQSLTGAPR